MTDTEILVCDTSLEGIFTAIYKAYEWRLDHSRTKLQIGEDDLCMFAHYRQVTADPALAAKVSKTIVSRFGQEAYEDICRALAFEAADRAQAVY